MPRQFILETALDKVYLRDLLAYDETFDQALGHPTALTIDLPVLLLPVRLLARFSPDGSKLKVRIVPDDIHIDALVRPLNARERLLGTAFWSQMDGASETAAAAAWERLVSHLGTTSASANRAAWIVRNTRDGAPPVDAESPPLVLPDQWMVIAWKDGKPLKPTWTSNIPRDLVGFDAKDPAKTDWLTDFDVAEAAGMATTLDLPAGTEKLDLLIAVGVDKTDSPDVAAARITDLLRAHRYRSGLEILPQGTPTNNTPDTRSAWHSSPDSSDIRERELAPIPLAAATNAGDIVAALGLDATDQPLAGVGGADLREQANAAAMIDVLWPVTGGEFLGVLLDNNVGPEQVPQGVQDFARTHASDYVRARGPLPALRVGKQPYGILPVTSLQRWTARNGDSPFFSGLRDRLLHVWPLWEAATKDVESIGTLVNGAGEVGATSIVGRLLGQSPVPHPTGYRAWSMLPPNFSWSVNPGIFSDTPLFSDLALGLLAFGYRPLIADVEPATKRPAHVIIPVVHADSGTWLRQLADLAYDRAGLIAFDPGTYDLLSQMVKRGLLRAQERDYVQVGLELTANHDSQVLWKSTFHNLVVGDLNVVGASPLGNLTLEMMGVTREEVEPKISIHDITINPPLRDILGLSRRTPEFRSAVAAIDTLEHLSTDELTLLFGETIDLYANRFDAWATSLATRRLSDLRKANPQGVHIGGYGWLVNLQAKKRHEVENPPEGVEKPVYDPVGDAGAIHAPSTAQAATAAVLRHGDLGDRVEGLGEGDTERRFDLTSASTRRALWLLETVRQGQPLAAALGYRVERMLQDEKQADLIDGLRRQYPLVGGESPDPEVVQTSIPPHDVIDGVALWRAIEEGQQMLPLPDVVVADLRFSVDAIADLLVVEGVHELLGGDHARAQATLTSLARGEAPPGDVRSIRNMRQGITVPMYLGFLITGSSGFEDRWSTERVRATIAPDAEQVAQALLPAPSACHFVIERGGGDRVTVGLSTLGLCALDVVCDAPGPDYTDSLLEQRILLAADAEGGRIEADPPPEILDAIGWGTLCAIAQRLRTVLNGARPMTFDDLEASHEDGAKPSEDEIASLTRTHDRLRVALEKVRAAGAICRDVAAGRSVKTLDELLPHLAILESCGIAGTIVFDEELPGDVAGRVFAHAATAIAQIDAYLDQEPIKLPVGSPVPAGQAEGAIDRLTRIAREVCGSAVVLTSELNLPDQMDHPPDLVDSDELADWIGELATVHPGTAALHSVWLASDVLTGRSPNLIGAQFPEKPEGPEEPRESWIGGWSTTQRPWKPPKHVRSAFVMQRIGPAAKRGQGLIVGSWTEDVPLPEREATGLAININATDARPPQSLLLAVPPDMTRPAWTIGDLVTILLETLELVRFRPVEPPANLPSREFLPAVFVPEGVSGVNFLSSEFLTNFNVAAVDFAKAFTRDD